MEKDLVEEVTALTKEAASNWLRDRIKAKLDAQGVVDRPQLIEALVAHFNSDQSDQPFSWSDPARPDEKLQVTVEITDEDLRDLDGLMDRILDTFPAAVRDATELTSKAILSSLKRKWPAVRASQSQADTAFCQRLEARWGKAFDLLRMMHYASTEIGVEAYKRMRRLKSPDNRVFRETLIRLHARAIQTMAEIISLMENGYADGASARWRTLHEIAAVATVISEGGPNIARRYLDHVAYDSLEEAKLHQRERVPLGDKPISKREMEALQKRVDQLVAVHGADFGKDNGWAAPVMSNPKKVTFGDIERAANRTWARSHYKLASYNIHAGSKGIFFKLGLLSGGGFIAGRSNAGLEEPGVNSAQALTQITALIMPERKGLDEATEIHAFLKMRDAAIRAFGRTASKLRREHDEVLEAAIAKRIARQQSNRSSRKAGDARKG